MTKILVILLLVLIWIFLIVKQAGSELTHEDIGSYSDQFIASNYVPYASKFDPPEIFDPCSCVSYYKWRVGLPQSISLGNAKDIMPWYLEPKESGMIITYEGGGHIAYYKKEGEYLSIYESNFEKCKTGVRQLKIGDPVIRGYR